MMWKPISEPMVLDLPLNLSQDVFAAWIPVKQTVPRDPLPKLTGVPFLNERESSTFKIAKRCEEHAAGRWLLAWCLRRVGLDPDSFTLERDEYRKPWLVGPSAPAVSISHSGGLAMVAIAVGRDTIGIDVEPLVERKRGILDFLCTPSESTSLEEKWDSDPNAASEMTNRLWVCKEAIQKAVGKGMGITPCSIEIGDLDSAVVEGEQYAVSQWTTVLNGMATAVAISMKA